MISDVFYDYYKNKVPEYRLTEAYFFYYVSGLLLKREMTSVEIEAEVVQSIGGLSLNHQHFDKTLERLFPLSNAGTFSLSEKGQQCYSMIKEFKSRLFLNEWEEENSLITKVGSFLSQRSFNVADSLPFVFALEKKQSNLPNDFYYSSFYDIVFNYETMAMKLDLAIGKIDDSFLPLPVSFIISDQRLKDILFSSGINSVKDLIELSLTSLVTLFALSIDAFISIFDSMETNVFLSYKEDVRAFFSRIPEDKLRIVKERYSFVSGKSKTLEEIAKEHGVTRERIRQIEAKIEKQIKEKSTVIRNEIICLYYLMKKGSSKYIEKSELLSFVNDNEVVDDILLILVCSDSIIAYDDDLEIIFDTSVASKETIVNEVCMVLGDYFSPEDYDMLSDSEKRIVSKNYNFHKNLCYLKKGKETKDLFKMVMDDIFPNGYRISDDGDYELLQKEYQRRFGTHEEFQSQRAVCGLLDRMDYVQIGRGCYKNIDYCPSISDELFDRIMNYILMNQPTVFYNSIFEHFKEEFTSLGIDNGFYVKGVLDTKLPDGFVTKRNYISTTKETVSSAESILGFFKSFNGAFTIEEVRDRFEGIKDYVFYNYLYSETDNGLIWLSSKKFVYLDKVILGREAIERLDEFIKGLFELLGARTITSAKIYGRLCLVNKQLLTDLKVATDQFSMFSLVRSLFKEKYYFSRPFIALDEEACTTRKGVISDYVRKLDSFNLSTINSFTSKMNVGGLYSYLEFMEDMSDEFVQISIDTMMKKEQLKITEDQLSKIRKMLNLIFDRFDEIKTETFNGYSMMPSLNIRWNKYLLVGIVRSFFENEYEVDDTDATYDKTEFIIRRIK